MKKELQMTLDHIKYLDADSFQKLEQHKNIEMILDFLFQSQLAAFEDKHLFLNQQTMWRIYDIYTTEDEYFCLSHVDLEESEFIREMVAREYKISDFRINDRHLVFNI